MSRQKASGRRSGLLRVLAAALSIGALAYSLAHLSPAIQAKSVRRISDKILDGGVFGDEFVRQVATVAKQAAGQYACEQGASEEFATLVVFVAGAALSTPGGQENGLSPQDARRYLISALRCSPAKPFLWFLLFWLDARTDVQQALPYLQMSYRLGPYEGWFGPARSRAAFLVLNEAPAELANSILSEYARLLSDDFETALGLFISANAATRSNMLRALSEAPVQLRKQFVRRLEGVDIKADLPN